MRHSITHNVANSATKLQIKCRIAKENPKITHILRRYLQQTAKRGSGVSKCQSVKLISAGIVEVLPGLNTNKTKTLTCQSFLHFRNMSFFAFSWNYLFILVYPGIAMSGIITKKDDEMSDLFKNSGQCRGKEVTLHLLL